MSGTNESTDIQVMSPSNADDSGPTISHNVTKVLEECVQAMVDKLPPSSAQKNKDRVKRPMNAFMVYSQTARKAMAKICPNLSYRKLSKSLGKNWGIMGLDEKRPFTREAERLRLKHKQEYPDYKFKPNKNRQTGNFAKKYNHPTTPKMAPRKKSNQVQESSSSSIAVCGKLSSETTPLQKQRLYFANNTFELSRQVNINDFRPHDMIEQDLVPVYSYNILNGSQEIFQREASSEVSPVFEPVGVSYKDSFPRSYPTDQLTEVDQSSMLNATPFTPTEATYPSADLVNFCNFIITEKQGLRPQIHTSCQNDF